MEAFLAAPKAFARMSIDLLAMDKDSLLYALSTLAQTSAALVAFVGALALFRLQQLKNSSEEVIRTLRWLLADLGLVPESVAMLPEERVLEDARAIVDGTYSHDSVTEVRIKKRRDRFEPELVVYNFLDVARGELLRQLNQFAVCHFVIILVCLLGFFGVRSLERCWISGAVFGLLSLGAVLVTGAMARKIWQPPGPKAFDRPH